MWVHLKSKHLRLHCSGNIRCTYFVNTTCKQIWFELRLSYYQKQVAQRRHWRRKNIEALMVLIRLPLPGVKFLFWQFSSSLWQISALICDDSWGEKKPRRCLRSNLQQRKCVCFDVLLQKMVGIGIKEERRWQVSRWDGELPVVYYAASQSLCLLTNILGMYVFLIEKKSCFYR